MAKALQLFGKVDLIRLHEIYLCGFTCRLRSQNILKLVGMSRSITQHCERIAYFHIAIYAIFGCN